MYNFFTIKMIFKKL